MTNGQAADYLLTLLWVDQVIVQKSSLVLYLTHRNRQVSHVIDTVLMSSSVMDRKAYLHAEYVEAADRIQAHVEAWDP